MGVVQGEDVRGPGADPDDVEFAALRALLIGPERDRLRQLSARLDDPVAHAHDVGRVLPQAMLLRARDPDLARALAPSVEHAITASVRKNPQPLAAALFPVMGPAIRRAVAASLAAMVDSINRTLEQSISWRALRWRLTALRTGRPFGEIVLLHTLLYRVEQVFLIDRRTGLLLQHVATSGAPLQDADMVSGMLTAIRDFVADSFRVRGTEGLEAMQVGELSVWIEQGPQAILAAVIRGAAPADLRQTLQQTLEMVHLETADALQSFDGDASPFEAVRPLLEQCLQAEYREERRKHRTAAWILLAVVILALAMLATWWWRDRARWERGVGALRSEPGIVVIAEGSRNGKYFVQGLRDPLAPDPATLLAGAGVAPAMVDSRWEAFQALHPEFVLRRARALLRPPPGVAFTFVDGVLRATGKASSTWIADAHRVAPLLAGVGRFDDGPLVDAALREVSDTFAGTTVLFKKGTSTPVPGQVRALADLRNGLATLDDLARATGTRVTVTAVGHADREGDERVNEQLSHARAQALVDALDIASLANVHVEVTGVGSSQPAATGSTGDDMRQNRRAVLRLEAQSPRGDGDGPR